MSLTNPTVTIYQFTSISLGILFQSIRFSVNIQQLLMQRISQAMIMAGADKNSDALIKQSAKAQFGDYQACGIRYKKTPDCVRLVIVCRYR